MARVDIAEPTSTRLATIGWNITSGISFLLLVIGVFGLSAFTVVVGSGTFDLMIPYTIDATIATIALLLLTLLPAWIAVRLEYVGKLTGAFLSLVSLFLTIVIFTTILSGQLQGFFGTVETLGSGFWMAPALTWMFFVFAKGDYRAGSPT